MSGLFNSRSSSQTSAAETGQQTGGASSPTINLSNIDQRKGKGELDLEVNLNSTDYGAIESALQYGGEAGMAALDYGRESLQFAGEAGADASRTVRESLSKVVGFATTANQSAEALANSAMGRLQESNDNALEFVAGGVQEAFELAESSQSAVDSIAGRSLAVVNDAWADSANQSAAAYVLALDSAEQGAAAQAQAFDKATNAIADANQSETAALSEKLVYGVMGLIAILAWRANA